MSIKQNGGVFGRNPTFNDVTIEGELTFDGDVDISSDLKIDGNLEVTGTSTIKALTVNTTDANHKISGGAGDIYTLYAGRSATDYYIGRDASGAILAVTGTAAPLLLKTNNTTRLNISTGGDVAVSTGNLVMSTSGSGIDFSATAGTGTSELLSDYEEGTYTAILTPTTGSITLQYDQLKYTKIGRLVTVMGLLRVDSVSSPIGDTTLNLPFTISTGSNYSNRSASSGYGSGFVSINSNEMSLVAVEGSAVVYFINTSGAAASGGAAGQQFQALTEFLVTLSYHTD